MNSKKTSRERLKQRMQEVMMGGMGIGFLAFMISDGLLAIIIAAVFGIVLAGINLR